MLQVSYIRENRDEVLNRLAVRNFKQPELVDQIILAARDGGASADQIAKRFFAERRYAGSKDRRAVRDGCRRAADGNRLQQLVDVAVLRAPHRVGASSFGS